jgi:hypothetical protein
MNIWDSESIPQRHEINSPQANPKGKIRTVAISGYALTARLVIRPDATRDSWSLLVNRCRQRRESHRAPIQLGEVVKIYDSLNSSNDCV